MYLLPRIIIIWIQYLPFLCRIGRLRVVKVMLLMACAVVVVLRRNQFATCSVVRASAYLLGY